MSRYSLDELARLWRLKRLSVEQAVGQLTLYAQDVAQQVPTQKESIDRLDEHLKQVESEMARLKEGKEHG